MPNEELKRLKDADLGFFPIELPDNYPEKGGQNEKDTIR